MNRCHFVVFVLIAKHGNEQRLHRETRTGSYFGMTAVCRDRERMFAHGLIVELHDEAPGPSGRMAHGHVHRARKRNRSQAN